jgi:hypothetical protein
MCEARAEYNKSPHKEDEKRAYELKPRERQLFLIYDHDDVDKGVQLWDVAYFNFGTQLDQYIDGARKQDKEAYSRFHHPIDGFEMRITGVEKSIGDELRGKNTVYSVHQFYKRDRELPRSVIEHGFDLDAMIREVEYDTLKKIYMGVDDEEDKKDSRNSRDDRDQSRDSRTAERSRRDTDPDLRRNQEKDDKDEAPPRREPPREERRLEPPREREPEPAPKPKPVKFATRDKVSFEYRGNPITGVIEKIDEERTVAHVRTPDREKPHIIDFEDLTLVSSDDTFDAKPPTKSTPEKNGDGKEETKTKTTTKRSWDDDDPDPVPPRRSGK